MSPHTTDSNTHKSTNTKVPFFTSFFRSQMSSVIATAVDFSLFIFLERIFLVYYVLAAGISAVAGAIVSFMLGRNWAFRKKDGRLTSQAFRYIITSSTSLVLNTYGIYLMTEYLHLEPIVSKIFISFMVGVFFNFLMYRYFVYK